jgi:protein O-GlcNAc transferase
VVLTYIDRKESKRLADHVSYLSALESGILHLKIRVIEFTAPTHVEQLRIVRETYVLVKVHGTGHAQHVSSTRLG